MKREDLVSIIMPVYNNAEYLKEAIESIINQTYQNWELIVIDDGSVDESCNIIMSYLKKEKRIKLISRENMGLVYSLNEGIEYARGEFIARMDGDDLCSPDKIEKQINYMWENPDVQIVGTNVKLFFEEGVSEKLKRESEVNQRHWNEKIDSENRFMSNMEGFKVVHATWMIRKCVFEQIGKYENEITEDGEFLFRATINGINIDKIDEELYQYRIRNNSKSDLDRNENLHKREMIKCKIEYLYSQYLDEMEHMRYMIWGADISGEIALEILRDKFPNAECIGIVDGVKKGKWHGYTIETDQECINKDWDFMFICTRGGAKHAMQFLNENGKRHIIDYMKVS